MIEAQEIVEMRNAGKTMAQAGYEAFVNSYGEKSSYFPHWSEVHPITQAAWEASAIELQRLRDAATMPVYEELRQKIAALDIKAKKLESTIFALRK